LNSFGPSPAHHDPEEIRLEDVLSPFVDESDPVPLIEPTAQF